MGQGCTSFGFVTTVKHSSIARERLEGYVRCMRAVDRPSASRIFAGDLSIEWGKEAANRLLDTSLPQAVVCANDLIAIGVLQAFRARHIRVPKDVAVTGYDDSTFASIVDPGLTSVRQPLGPLGQEAVRFITSAIESPGLPARELRLLPELIVRGSSRFGRSASSPLELADLAD